MSTPYTILVLSETGLIDYWEMTEASGTTTTDSAGSHPLTIGGTHPPTLGQTGIPAGNTSYLFNGVGGSGTDSYTATTPAWNTGGTAITLEAWVYIPTTLSVTSWVAGINYTSFNVFQLDIVNMKPRAVLWDTTVGVLAVTAINNLSTGNWHYLCLTATNAGFLNLYVDSVQQTPTPMTGNILIATGGTAGVGWNIGGCASIGDIDATYQICNVALYDVALTPTQITDHWKTGMNLNAPAGNPAALLPAM